MPFKTPGKTSEYLRTVIRPESDPRVAEMMRYADEQMIPILLPESAVFLEQITKFVQPKKTLEIGMVVGYSSQLILRNSDTHLYTVEINEQFIDKGKEFLNSLGYGGRYTVFCGDAGEIVPYIDGHFDFIFMDGPKTRYLEYLPHLKRMLNSGGVLLCDNVLFNGMVSGESDIEHKKLSIINRLDEFLRALTKDEEYVTSILPVGDGMSLSIKK